MLRKSIVVLGFLSLALVSCGKPPAQGISAGLDSVAPEDVGWSSAKLEEARAFAEKIDSAAVMVLYDGKVFVSWGNVARKYRIHSIRKPLLSALYGIYWGRGKIRLDATLEELEIDDIPPFLTKEEKKATVADLLKSCSGVYHEAAAETDGMAQQRPGRGSHPPGTFYYYNNWDFNALGTIFEKMTGAKIFEAFKTEIAEPIGMEDFSLEDCQYSYERDKSMHPAYNFRMTARDMARFGLLYLRKGEWNGKQIIPREWIEMSTTAYSMVSEQFGVGYGYLWNVVKPGTPFSQIMYDGKGGFFHTGMGIHALAVSPENKLVYVYRYDTDGEFKDPGEATIQLVSMIMNARLAKKARPEESGTRATLEEKNGLDHGQEHAAGIKSDPANRQNEKAHPEEESQNALQPPERIMDAIGLKAGMTVGEVGAGWGRFTVHLARRVGKSGLVYANDIDKGALDLLEQRSQKEGLSNIRTVLGQVHDPCFLPRSLDIAFMINVYNAFEDPARFLRNIAPALKPGGVLTIVLDDPAKSGGESSRSATREEFLASVDRAGYKVEKEETFLQRDGLYVLRLK